MKQFGRQTGSLKEVRLFSWGGICNSSENRRKCDLKCVIEACPEVKDWQICTVTGQVVAKLFFSFLKLGVGGRRCGFPVGAAFIRYPQLYSLINFRKANPDY